jgi:hypothetical protein
VEKRARPSAEPSLSAWVSGGSILEVGLMEIDPMPLIPGYYFTQVVAVIVRGYIYKYLSNILGKYKNCTRIFDLQIFTHA